MPRMMPAAPKGYPAARAGGVHDRDRPSRKLGAQLFDRAHVAPGADWIRAAFGDEVGFAAGLAELLGDERKQLGAPRVLFARNPADFGAAQFVEQDVGFDGRRLRWIGHAWPIQ